MECGELETKTESISEEVADLPKASNRSTITVDIEDDMGTEAPDDLMLNGKAADLPIAIDIEEDEFTQVGPSKGNASGKGTDADSESSRKSSESSTLKQHSETSAVTSNNGGPRRSSEPKKYFPHHSSVSDDNVSVNKSSAESVADNQFPEMSSQQQHKQQCLALKATNNNNNNANDRADKDADDESEVTSETSSTTATGAGPPTPPSIHSNVNCELCACGTPPSAPPPIERLLPIGGELSESVRHSLSRRPYPSMMNPSTAAPPPPPSLPPSSSGATTGPNFERSEPYDCCCCYQQSITGCPVSSCCVHYQQTIEAYKKQHAAATRELSRERLLPIGPKPQVNQSSANSSRPGSSQHHYSHSSRSVERKVPGDWCKSKPAGKLLIRQHTTIGPDEQNHRRHRGPHSSSSVIRGVLLSSKSMDSVPDNYKTKFERGSHKTQQQQPQPKTIATTSNSASSSSIAGGENVVSSSNHEETTFGISSSQQNIRTTRRSTTHNSEESICTSVKEQPPTFGKPKTSTSSACNGNLDETATESEQETSKSSKEPGKGIKTSLGSDTAITNGIDNGKQLGEKGKKRAKKKSKKNKSSKSTPASTTNNTPSHQLHQQQVSSPTAATAVPSFVLGTDVESPVGDNEVFNPSQANTPDYVGSGKSRAMQSQQPDSAKDTTSGRSNEASSSSNTDLTSNAFEMCTICGMPIEKFDEQELGLCLVSLATFVHRDPSLAAPLLPNILKLASRYAIRHAFSWQIGRYLIESQSYQKFYKQSTLYFSSTVTCTCLATLAQ